MVIRFAFEGNIFFLAYRTEFKGSDACKGLSSLVKVERKTDTSWTVTDNAEACVKNHPDKGKPIVCFTDEMNFSFDVECLDEDNCPPGP